MQKTYYILHGLGGHSGENWFPWLKQQLEKMGHKAIVPNFPNPFSPVLDDWLNTLRREISENGEGILIGHSLGGVLAIKYIEAGGLPHEVILTATPFGILDDIPEINSFLEKPIKLSDDIKKQVKFTVLYSDNDPYVPVRQAKDWERLLNVKPIKLSGVGHMKVLKLPEILDYV